MWTALKFSFVSIVWIGWPLLLDAFLLRYPFSFIKSAGLLILHSWLSLGFYSLWVIGLHIWTFQYLFLIHVIFLLFRLLQNMRKDGKISSKNWKLFLPMWYVILPKTMIFCTFSLLFNYIERLVITTRACIWMLVGCNLK